MSTNDLLRTISQLGINLEVENQKYYPGRVIDRKKVYKRLFKGEKLTHEDMFSSRGYRGLNIIEYPKHVKKQIQ